MSEAAETDFGWVALARSEGLAREQTDLSVQQPLEERAFPEKEPAWKLVVADIRVQPAMKSPLVLSVSDSVAMAHERALTIDPRLVAQVATQPHVDLIAEGQSSQRSSWLSASVRPAWLARPPKGSERRHSTKAARDHR